MKIGTPLPGVTYTERRAVRVVIFKSIDDEQNIDRGITERSEGRKHDGGFEVALLPIKPRKTHDDNDQGPRTDTNDEKEPERKRMEYCKLPGGGIEYIIDGDSKGGEQKMESHEVAVKREAREETGWEVRLITPDDVTDLLRRSSDIDIKNREEDCKHTEDNKRENRDEWQLNDNDTCFAVVEEYRDTLHQIPYAYVAVAVKYLGRQDLTEDEISDGMQDCMWLGLEEATEKFKSTIQTVNDAENSAGKYDLETAIVLRDSFIINSIVDLCKKL